jgi:serine/threonine protein kinase
MPRDLITIVGNLQIDRGNILGTGGYGRVFRGIFYGEKVAVKRVDLIINTADNRELENNQKLSRLNHPNIVQFKHYEEDDNFR